MNLREIDGVTWCPIDEVIPGLDILEEYLSNGATIGYKDKLWWLFESNGEGKYCGSTIREMLIAMILGG